MHVVVSSDKLEEPPSEIMGINSVVVKDNFGNPIFVAIHQSDENIWVMTPDDPRFSDIVQGLGITKRLAVTVGGI